jgi:hypothetical protein
MSTITSANLANAIVKLVANDALTALMGNFVMGNLVNRDYEPVLAHAGDTVNVPIPPTLVANNIAEGGTVTPQNPDLGNAQIVLNTHAESTFQIPDVTKALAFPELLKAYMQPAVVAIAERVERDLLSLYEATIDVAETTLFQAEVPPSAPKYLVVDSTTYSQLRQIPRFSEYYSAGEAGLRTLVEGNIGKIKDFFIFRSQYVPMTGTASPNIHNLAFTRDAIGLVIRRLPQPLPGTGAIAEYGEMGNFGIRVVMSYQPNTLSQQFTVDVLYGTGVLRNNFAVQVNS